MPEPKRAVTYRQWHRRLFELVLFALLADVMFASKMIMEALPNIHLLAMLITVYTLVFRAKALIPIYLYVLLDGLIHGFAMWWVPYLYVWTVLWGVIMLLPRSMPRWLAIPVYAAVCGLHGVLFGVLYAPAQAIMWHLDFEGMLAWIATGFLFDVIHGISNFVVALLLIYPLTALLEKTVKRMKRY